MRQLLWEAEQSEWQDLVPSLQTLVDRPRNVSSLYYSVDGFPVLSVGLHNVIIVR